MKSKAPLMLIEQIVLLLVFAFVAALCMQAFVKSEQISAQSEARDHAVVLVQSAAETLRHNNGDIARSAEELGGTVAEGILQLAYDEKWNQTDMRDNGAYLLCAQPCSSDVQGLGKARVWLASSKTDTQNEEADDSLFSIEIAWQEVGGNAQN